MSARDLFESVYDEIWVRGLINDVFEDTLDYLFQAENPDAEAISRVEELWEDIDSIDSNEFKYRCWVLFNYWYCPERINNDNAADLLYRAVEYAVKGEINHVLGWDFWNLDSVWEGFE